MTAIIIVLCVALIICVIAVLIAFYHQMLMTNEINKRLLLLTEDSIQNERNTMDALTDKLQEQELILKDKFENKDTQEEPDEETSFNPHDALDELE